jgi:hypothetical protein
MKINLLVKGLLHLIKNSPVVGFGQMASIPFITWETWLSGTAPLFTKMGAPKLPPFLTGTHAYSLENSLSASS